MWEFIGKAAVIIFIARILYSLLRGLYSCFIASALGLNETVRKYGKWAVVTGATDGIGKAYAFELARQGMDLVLLSRTLSKLQNVSAEIVSKYKVETKLIDVDFTKTNIYQRIKDEIGDMDIAILINNVGMGYEHPEYFHDADKNDCFFDNLIHCNITSLTMMTKIVLPGMLKKEKGIVINVSSLSATMPTPLLSVYAASKAYVDVFSQSLSMEYRKKGIIVQCILPGYVVSKLSKIRNPSIIAPSPDTFVKAAMKTLGVERRSGGYYIHKLQIYFIEVFRQYFPPCIIGSFVMKELLTTRARFLKKLAKESKAN